MRVAFGFEQRAGKDTAAEYLISRFGGRILKFADPLYEIEAAAHRIAGLPPPDQYLKTMRRGFLKYVGTEWGRDVHGNDIWANAMDRRLSELSSSENLFITDTRFKNEVEVARKHGFVIVKITRPLAARLEAGATPDQHRSDVELANYDEWDAIIENNDDLPSFHRKLDDVAAWLEELKCQQA